MDMPKRKMDVESKAVVEDKSLIDPRNHHTEDNETRRQSAVNMLIAGASYSEIAQVLGYSTPATARRSAERGIAEAAVTDDDRDKARWLLDRRLERLWTSVSAKANDSHAKGHLDYVAAALRIIDRKMTLHHLGGTNVTVTPAADRVREVVAKFEGLIASGEDDEADIMDATVVEEDRDEVLD